MWNTAIFCVIFNFLISCCTC